MKIGIVNDLPVAAELLRRLIHASGEHQIVWIARDGAEAVTRCERDLPELVLMDLIMPYVDGVEATRQIMSRTPCPILILTATVGGNSAKVYEALGAGAVDAIDIPAASPSTKTARALLRKIKHIERQTVLTEDPAEVIPATGQSATTELILIGASAGGPSALAEVLSALPQDFSPAIIVVQHIDQKFAAGFVDWLGKHSKLPSRLVRAGDAVSPGTVFVADGKDHLVFRSPDCLGYTAEPVDNPYRPSVDVLFGSAARWWSGLLAGVLLTGMGGDGAKGLKTLRDAGFPTIAQDESSSAVYAMPKAAAAIGAASEILPLQKIGPRLREIFGPEVKATASNAAGAGQRAGPEDESK